ncbi:MAG TPA: imidazolonepropionase, partial [Puia sp.]|nr:imidazolonepropionase [Puia sp.]
MAVTLITNIHQLVNTREKNKLLRGKDLSELPLIENAWIKLENKRIAGYGRMEELAGIAGPSSFEMIDARRASVLPCWCDSHTHLVFAGDRQEEFVDKIKGLTYAEISAKGGGILNTAKKLQDTSEEELFNLAWKRLEEVGRLGTGAVEIKSGYGLTLESELKILRVIKNLKEKSALSIRSTFLGAHSYPEAYRENHQAYIELIIEKMLPAISEEKLADYIDVFCEKGFFSPEETETICRAGLEYGLKPKLHVNQLNSLGGIQT